MKHVLLVTTGFLLLGLVGCASGEPEAGATTAPEALPTEVASGAVPAEYEPGQAAFESYCVECHGPAATGTDQGPPLVHRYYEPNHHPDAAFQNAASLGVRQHHWQFGNMPPVEEVSPAELTEIIAYVRWLQREAGIY